MPYCPECNAEYDPGTTRCPDCDRELVDDADDDELDDEIDEEAFIEEEAPPVLLYQTNNMVNAEVLEEALKDQGIPCLIKSGTGTYSGLSSLSSTLKGVKIFVPESALEEAIEVAEMVIPDYERPED